MLPRKTKVKHRRLNYFGFVAGITKIKEIFTGNVDCDWQYRIEIPKEDRRRIAPEEDLIVVGMIATKEACLDRARVILRLEKSERERDSEGTVCIFNISAKTKIAIPIIYDTNKWVYTKVRSRTAERKLECISEQELKLGIRGGGHDNRCRWCRTFRTALKTKIINALGEGAFYQDGFCFFEREHERLLEDI
ncbi:MAG: hypothetical protein HQ593_00210 [Candidatus Omnitrophica bacterium]|nr:hypothetical protein [Candidatus Omnitrophota bacterium]